MKKNILFIIESSETGGAESVFAELVQRIDRERFVPHVALLYDGWLFDRLRTDGIVPQIISAGRGGFDIRLLLGIYATIRKLNIDLIHSHLFTTNIYSSVCGAITNNPVISTFHGTMDVDSMDSLKRIKWLAVNRCSASIVFVSKYLKNYFVSHKLARELKSKVIHNGIDLERFRNGPTMIEARNELGLPANSFVVGCVGDLRPAKDYQSALRAMHILKGKIPGLKLVIAGTKTDLLNDLVALAESLGIEENVHFLGYRSAIERVFPAFDIYLSSSISEGFSLTVVEAMAAGLPVVATCSGGPEEIISNGQNGLLVEVNVPDKIAAAIENIYSESAFGNAIAMAGRQHAEIHFSIQSMVRHYEELYMTMVQSYV